jgi:hypothetical protein
MRQFSVFSFQFSVIRSRRRFLSPASALFAFCLLSFVFCLPAAAQVKVELDEGGAAKGRGAAFGYKFENQRFHISLIEIELDQKGEGILKFKRGESDDVIDLKLKLQPETLARLRHLYASTRFLESDENYQDSKDHSNLGWVTLSARDGERERQARFNYTPNQEVKELADIYRALATQQILLFDLETALQYQPLDVPRLLETMENDLKNGWLAEPAALLPALRDIAGNDSAPLIARNHARRLIASIDKGKFKTPIKK